MEENCGWNWCACRFALTSNPPFLWFRAFLFSFFLLRFEIWNREIRKRERVRLGRKLEILLESKGACALLLPTRHLYSPRSSFVEKRYETFNLINNFIFRILGFGDVDILKEGKVWLELKNCARNRNLPQFYVSGNDNWTITCCKKVKNFFTWNLSQKLHIPLHEYACD